MDWQWFVAVTTFCVVTTFTPGPNNTMLMASGINFGWRRSLPHILGVSFGFPLMVLGVGLGVAQVFAAVPALYDLLRIFSIVYLIWLAWQIATTTKQKADERRARPLTFTQAAAFQWVNPKAWVMAIGVSVTYLVAQSYMLSLIFVVTLCLVAGLCSSNTWVVGGAALRRWLNNPRRLTIVNVTLAILLVASLIPIVLDMYR